MKEIVDFEYLKIVSIPSNSLQLFASRFILTHSS